MAATWNAKKIKKLRERLQENQAAFAKRFRVSVESVRVWEQEKGLPSGPVQVLMDLTDSDPALTLPVKTKN